MLPSKKTRNRVTNLAGILFLAIAVFHLARSVFLWEATISGWVIPFWVSWFAVLMALYLSYYLFLMDK